MKKNLKVAILGAGFSGLTLAWALQKKGVKAMVYEKQKYPGGLIQTRHQKVMVETAAHAIMNSQDVEDLFSDLGIEMLRSNHISNAKWIFRKTPKRWPLRFFETLKSIGVPRRPKRNQMVADWASSNFSKSLNDYLLAPALQGVYAAQSDQLSASLVFKKDPMKKGRFKGSVAPKNGMSEIFKKLSQKIDVQYESNENIESLQKRYDVVVLATSIDQAGQLLKTAAPQLSAALLRIPKVSLVSATIKLTELTDRVRGFGCLFPKLELFNSLGVLFNSDIFENRGDNSETWILGESHAKASDQEILEAIKQDRQRLSKQSASIEFSEIHRWPNVLPLYGKELENLLPQLPEGDSVATGVYLTGNYLGGIGLAKILSYNHRLTNKILKDYV